MPGTGPLENLEERESAERDLKQDTTQILGNQILQVMGLQARENMKILSPADFQQMRTYIVSRVQLPDGFKINELSDTEIGNIMNNLILNSVTVAFLTGQVPPIEIDSPHSSAHLDTDKLNSILAQEIQNYINKIAVVATDGFPTRASRPPQFVHAGTRWAIEEH